MKSRIEDMLARVLDDLEHGKSIQDCLAEFPEHAEELAPLLQLAGAIKQVPKPVPRPEAVREVIRNVRRGVRRNESPASRFFLRSFWLRPAFVRTALAACLFIVLGWTTVRLSAASLPGEFLYPVKRLSEQVQYFFTTSPEGKAELHILFADRRTSEFVMTIEPGERVDHQLLETMLQEAASAQQLVNALSGEHGEVLQKKIEACDRDRDLIDAAIRTCRRRSGCMPDAGDADDPCCD
jgi:hypothetical protein